MKPGRWRHGRAGVAQGWGFAGPVAGLVEIGVGFLELGNGMGDPRRVGSSQAWVAVYGLRNVGLRALRFFVNLWKAAGAYGGSSGCMENMENVAVQIWPADFALVWQKMRAPRGHEGLQAPFHPA